MIDEPEDDEMEEEGTEESHANESLKATEAEASEGRTAPRVSLSDIENNIEEVYYLTGAEALESFQPVGTAFECLTLCFVEMKNGFIVIGKSAPASAENFDAQLGRKFAYEDAIRQLWPLMGFALRDKLSKN